MSPSSLIMSLLAQIEDVDPSITGNKPKGLKTLDQARCKFQALAKTAAELRASLAAEAAATPQSGAPAVAPTAVPALTSAQRSDAKAYAATLRSAGIKPFAPAGTLHGLDKVRVATRIAGREEATGTTSKVDAKKFVAACVQLGQRRVQF